MPNLNVGLGLAVMVVSGARGWTDIDIYECGVWDVLTNMEQNGLLGRGTCDDIIYGCLDWGNNLVSCEEIASNNCTMLIGVSSAREAAKELGIDVSMTDMCDYGCEIGEYMSVEYSQCKPCDSGTYSNGATTECYACPSHTSGVVYSVASTGEQSDCYVPASASWSFSDSAGSGTAKFTSDCYWN